MSQTVKLLDDDAEEQTYTVPKGYKLPKADGSGFAEAYFVEGALDVTANGIYDVRDKASAVVNVPTGGGSNAALIGVLDGTITALTAQDLAGLTDLRDSALYGLQSLASVVFQSGLTTIGYNALADCPSLSSVTFPDTVQIIGQMAFSGCSELSSVVWGNSITEIWGGAFLFCVSLTDVDLPSIQSIGPQAFAGCSALEIVRLGNSCTGIGNDAFIDCTSLLALTVEATTPPTLVSDALDGCTSLQHIYVPSSAVNAYKTAAGWSAYANYIEAIPTT